MSIEKVLAASRRGVRRLTAVEAMAAAYSGALLIDTRTELNAPSRASCRVLW